MCDDHAEHITFCNYNPGSVVQYLCTGLPRSGGVVGQLPVSSHC